MQPPAAMGEHLANTLPWSTFAKYDNGIPKGLCQNAIPRAIGKIQSPDCNPQEMGKLEKAMPKGSAQNAIPSSNGKTLSKHFTLEHFGKI